ncbi:TPT-domain-containing protein [Ramicandelaber brevisporus]|nr:TPT-domain-containing protein [Ramicandelaber brevisporus]
MSKAELHAELRTTVLVNLALILTWYLFSTGLSVYNRWLFGEKNMNFKYPFFVSAGHMLIQFVLSGLSILAITKLRPKVRPGLRNYFTKAVPCGVASACDIGLSNLSLHSITLSFYTMCKSSSPAFILLFAFLFKLEKPRWQLIGVIVIISGGVFLMAATEVNFVLAGFLQVMAAAAFGGLRWSLTQMLLQRESSGMNNPIASIFYMAPIIGTSLIVASFIFEHPLQLGSTKFFATAHAAWSIIGTIAGGGLLAFMMMLSEFALISRTSVVTLSVAGIFKEIVTIIISMLTFNDKLTILNVVGLLIALVGIALYNVYKITQVRADIERKHNAPSAANDVTNPSSSPSSGPSVPMRRLPDTRQAANGKYSALHDGDDDLNDLGDDDDIEDEDPAAAPSHRPRHP